MVVDAVVTWVDGADKAHAKKRLKAFKSLHESCIDEEAAAPTRFQSVGEIDYCIRSLLKFAPWLRTIYIVTDGQTPAILKTLQHTQTQTRLTLVDHQEIFKGYENYLPTFNSLTIESMLWRIPELSEQFIYLNDDCVLLRPVTPEAFFLDGKMILRGCWKTQKAYQLSSLIKHCLGIQSVLTGNRLIQEHSARLVGFKKKYIHLPHVPFPLLKSVMADFFTTHPTLLSDNIQHPFRHATQFWSISLVYHLGFKQNQVIMDNRLNGVTINPAHHSTFKIKTKLARALKSRHTVFACMQSLDQATPLLRSALLAWLETCMSNMN